MSELTTFDDMTIEAIEVACQSAFEECESVFRAIDSKKNQLEIFGRLLTAAKKKVAHGEWENWLTDTFGGRLKLRTAQLWMSKAQKVALLDTDERPRIVPRAERKTGRVKVAETSSPETPDNLKRDPDPNPAPRTNTLHKPATAKAREADRQIPAVVTPEIMEEPGYDRQAWDDPVPEKTLADWSVAEMLAFLKDSADEPKKRAKELRKAADELDPPKVDKTPSKSQLIAMIPDDWAPELQRAAADWAEYKQARAKGERIQTVRAWELALEQFTTQPSRDVISKVNKAIENSWKGWNHDSKTGNGNSAGKVTTGRIKPTAEDPKITYV